LQDQPAEGGDLLAIFQLGGSALSPAQTLGKRTDGLRRDIG
jgi:hypothetical protein